MQTRPFVLQIFPFNAVIVNDSKYSELVLRDQRLCRDLMLLILINLSFHKLCIYRWIYGICYLQVFLIYRF